jgi:hypothetical protein
MNILIDNNVELFTEYFNSVVNYGLFRFVLQHCEYDVRWVGLYLITLVTASVINLRCDNLYTKCIFM